MCTEMNAKREIENKHVSELQLYFYRSMSIDVYATGASAECQKLSQIDDVAWVHDGFV